MWQYGDALWLPLPLGICGYFFCPLLRFSASVGAVLSSLFGFPCLRVGTLLACGVCGASLLRSLQYRLPFVISPPSLVSVCPSPALAGQVVGTLSCGRSCGSCVLSSRGSLVRHSVPLVSCHTLSGSSLRLTVSAVSWSKLLEFSWTLWWGSSLSLPVFAVCSECLSDIPWLSALRCLAASGVPWFFCRGPVGLP